MLSSGIFQLIKYDVTENTRPIVASGSEGEFLKSHNGLLHFIQTALPDNFCVQHIHFEVLLNRERILVKVRFRSEGHLHQSLTLWLQEQYLIYLGFIVLPMFKKQKHFCKLARLQTLHYAVCIPRMPGAKPGK